MPRSASVSGSCCQHPARSPSEMRKLRPGEGAGVVECHSRKQGVELDPRTADSQACPCSVPLSEKATLAPGLPPYLRAPSVSDTVKKGRVCSDLLFPSLPSLTRHSCIVAERSHSKIPALAPTRTEALDLSACVAEGLHWMVGSVRGGDGDSHLTPPEKLRTAHDS